ncbi:MAG: adenylate/guanylate cyclase domain-containing protein, partial [Rhodospirillales bacterium]
EENDLFGATVQLAARVCAQAKAGQILCSKSVRDLAKGREGQLTALGEVMLKGFKEPVPIFEVSWTEPVRTPSSPAPDSSSLPMDGTAPPS